jgi:DNA-binding SARP family transcriptional activator
VGFNAITAAMDFRILGPLEVTDDGAALPLGGSKQRALLALLVLHANETLSASRLIDELWGERPPVTATKALRVHVSRLRKTLTQPVLVTRGSGYELAVAPARIDAHRFEGLLREARAAPPARAAPLLEDALALWRGEPLADIAHEPFVGPYAARLVDLELAALEQLIEAKLALGAHDESIARLEALIAEHPYRERFRGQLMVALYRSGRQADALQAYRDARRALTGDLGIEPGAHLRDLERAILAQDPALAAPAAAAYAPPAAQPLPRALRLPAGAAFAGRERELARLRDAWGRVADGGSAAVLLSGEAGIGKTRLAAELAATVRRAGATVLYGRCDEDLAVPYQPFVEALGPRFPEAAHRLALFAATAERLDGQVVVLDDLHWATAPTLQMLRHVICAEPRALILGTYRDTELEPGHLLRTLPVERIELKGLDEPAIAALLGDAHAPGLPARLLEQTNGNPFFVLAHRGEPAALRDVIAQRVARLGPDAQRLMSVAAVAGPEFSVTVVEHALDADALDALDEATAAGLLTERGHGDYAFTHALVRQAIYDGLTSARRARLHRGIGEALEGTGDAPVEALAHHFAEAEGGADKAAEYALAAGRDAIRRLGYEEAAGHLQRGLRAVGPRHPRRRELARELRRTRYEPMPDLGGMPAWIWRGLPRAGKVAVAAVPFVVLALVLAFGPGIQRSRHERERVAQERAARADAADLARVQALQRPHLARGAPAGSEAQARGRLLATAAGDIRADAARQRAILRVDCDPYPSAAASRGRYECLAVTADVPATERTPAAANGLAYRVLVDFDSGRYGYCRLAPRAAKVQRKPVPLSPLCGGGEVKGEHG